MSKIAIFDFRQDEINIFNKISQSLKLNVIYINEQLTMNSVAYLHGVVGITIQGRNSSINSELLKKLSNVGIKYLVVRSSGVNNINITNAHQYGIKVSNVSYSPNSVAEFTIMLMLMILRKIKLINARNEAQNFSLSGIQGSELSEKTVGIIGTGAIGIQVAKLLNTFGCRVLAYNHSKKDALKGIVTYTTFNELISKSDVITLHLPLNKSTFHIIDTKEINNMRKNSILINCARGALVNTTALINGIASLNILGAGLDTIEHENTLFQQDHQYTFKYHKEWQILKGFPNVILTPHTAFYTDRAVYDMVSNSLKSLYSFIHTDSSPWEIGIGK